MSTGPEHKFLNREFFERVVRKEYPDNDEVRVVDVELSAALAKGENFSSHIIRAKVSYVTPESGTRHFIVKVPLKSEESQELLDEFFIFHRETVVYESILPAMEALLLSSDDKTKLAPRVFSMGKKPEHFLFEDLGALGYVKPDRKRGLDNNEAKLVLQTLAKFHAASAVLFQNDPDSMTPFHFQNISAASSSFYPLFVNSMASLASKVDEWGGLETISSKLHRLTETDPEGFPRMMRKAFGIYTWDQEGFNVLTHGDMWINNVLFKYDEKGALSECTFVDFATGYFGSPAIDLCYFLFGSTSSTTFEETFDRLIADYHEELVRSLGSLGYQGKVPSLTEIHIEVLRKGFVGVIFCSFLIPLRLIPNSEDADLGSLLGNDERSRAFKDFLFSVEGYRERITYLLQYFDRKGLLEVD